MKKITAFLLHVIFVMGVVVNVAAAPGIEDTARYLTNTVNTPTVASVGGEWTVIGLARSGLEVENEYFETYYANVLRYVKARKGVLHARKHTEYARVILALSAIGKDPENVAGYTLLPPLLDYDKTILQGINGSIWAMIALDSGNYGTQEIRKKYITHILNCEKQAGGWSLSETEQSADADVTAMALIALSNYQDRKDVKLATDRALHILSSMQNENAGYSAYNTETSESAAQVLTALSALHIPYTDTRFVKNGKTLPDILYSYKQKDGSFSHTEETNLMATEQCFYALVAANRCLEQKAPLFDMRDVKRKENPNLVAPEKNNDVNVPEIKFPGKTFSDIAGHKHQAAIEELTERGIINGMDETTFAPDTTMTRAAFAAITVRALGLPIKSNGIFRDVAPGEWYAAYVDTTHHFGIVSGVSETDFYPDGTITKEQAAVMVCRAAKICGIENKLDDFAVRNILAEFTDYMSVSQWAKASVAFCFENGILDRSELEIKPTEAITRGRIADMLYALLKGAMLI